MTPVDVVRQELVRRARARHDELLGAILFALVDAVPEYGRDVPRRFVDDIRNGVERNIDLCLRAVEEGRRLGSDERVALHLAGAQRAQQGISRAAVLESVKVATRAERVFLTTCADVAGDGQCLMAAMGEALQLIDRFEDDAGSALGAGWDRAAGSQAGAEVGVALAVDRLLDGLDGGRAAADSPLSELGFDLSRSLRLVVACTLGAFDERRVTATAEDLESDFVVAVGPVRCMPRSHVPVVVQPANDDGWGAPAAVLDAVGRRRDVVMVAAPPVGDPTVLTGQYRAVRPALSFVAAAAPSAGLLADVIVRFHSTMFAGTMADRRALLAEVVAPLDALPAATRNDLLDVVDARYEVGGSASAVARRLRFHKNTVHRRLKLLHECTGLDMHRPAERLVLETMLRLRRVADAELPIDPTEWWSGRGDADRTCTGGCGR